MNKSDFMIIFEISFFRLLIRSLSLFFLFSSTFTKDWFIIANIKNSILVKIGIFRYCNDLECFTYRENPSINKLI